MSHPISQITVHVRAHTRHVVVIIRIAQLLLKLHQKQLARLWLRLMQPACVIRLRVEGDRRWSRVRVPLDELV